MSLESKVAAVEGSPPDEARADRTPLESTRWQAQAFRWVVLILAASVAATFLSLWAPLVLATWLAVIARPLFLRAAKAIGGHRAAGALVLLLVMAIFVPIAGAVLSLYTGAVELARSMLHSADAKSALVAIVSDARPTDAGGGASPVDSLLSPSKIFPLLQEHGATVARVLSGAAGAATAVLIGLFVFFYAIYVFLTDGPSYYEWLEKHAPIEPSHTRRLAAAFNETGRGLFVGVGLTGLTQGVIATTTYFALGVPRALVLGLLTCVASLIPSVGTALIWVPVAVGLALSGRTVPAAIMTGVGVLVIGTIDNVMRPTFARLGKLELPTFVLLTSIFGGLAMFGAWGVILGPLAARLAKEAFLIARSDRTRISRPSTSSDPPGS